MVKKWLCITGCIVHFLFAVLLLVWVAKYCDIPYKKRILISDVLFVILCVFIGIAFLKLDINKLFWKLEVNGVSGFDKTVLLTGLITALLVVGFEILMVSIYFFKGVKMEPAEFIRFTVLPSLSLSHLTMGTGCYLAFQYFIANST